MLPKREYRKRKHPQTGEDQGEGEGEGEEEEKQEEGEGPLEQQSQQIPEEEPRPTEAKKRKYTKRTTLASSKNLPHSSAAGCSNPVPADDGQVSPPRWVEPCCNEFYQYTGELHLHIPSKKVPECYSLLIHTVLIYIHCMCTCTLYLY